MYLKLKFEVNENCAGRATQTLEECGALAVTIEDGGNEAQFEVDPNTNPLWTRNCITGLFPATIDMSAIIQQLERSIGDSSDYVTESLADCDWVTAGQEHHRPLRIAAGLWVCPRWSTPPQPDAINIFIDPGLAFGSGSHPTTRLCLEWLADYRFTNERVIDYGCGSGILAIAALKRGAQYACGVDKDSRALQVSQENAAYNGVADRYQVFAPQCLPQALKADIVLANILAEPLLELAPDLLGLVRPGGRLILSGLLAEQVDVVGPRFTHRFEFECYLRDDETHAHRWAVLIGSERVSASP